MWEFDTPTSHGPVEGSIIYSKTPYLNDSFQCVSSWVARKKEQEVKIFKFNLILIETHHADNNAYLTSFFLNL